MSVLARLTVTERTIIRRVRLPELPVPGDLIELADGTRVIVERVESSPLGGDDAEVHARPA